MRSRRRGRSSSAPIIGTTRGVETPLDRLAQRATLPRPDRRETSLGRRPHDRSLSSREHRRSLRCAVHRPEPGCGVWRWNWHSPALACDEKTGLLVPCRQVQSEVPPQFDLVGQRLVPEPHVDRERAVLLLITGGVVILRSREPPIGKSDRWLQLPMVSAGTPGLLNFLASIPTHCRLILRVPGVPTGDKSTDSSGNGRMSRLLRRRTPVFASYRYTSR